MDDRQRRSGWSELDGPALIRTGMYEVPAELRDDQQVVSQTPCHRVEVLIPAQQILPLGQTDWRCAECNKLWTVRFDPARGRTSLWIE